MKAVKTVWHWRNISRSICALIAVASAWSLIYTELDIPKLAMGVIISMSLGGFTSWFCMSKWPMWHFEWRE